MKRYADHTRQLISNTAAKDREMLEVPITKRQFQLKCRKVDTAYIRNGIKPFYIYLPMTPYEAQNIDEAYYKFCVDADRFLKTHGIPIVQPRSHWEKIDAGYIEMDVWVEPLPIQEWIDLVGFDAWTDLIKRDAGLAPNTYNSRWKVYFRPNTTKGAALQPIGEIEVMSGKFNGWYYGIQPNTLDEKLPHFTTFEAVKKALVQHINHEYFFGPGSSSRPPEVQLLEFQDMQDLVLN